MPLQVKSMKTTDNKVVPLIGVNDLVTAKDGPVGIVVSRNADLSFTIKSVATLEETTWYHNQLTLVARGLPLDRGGDSDGSNDSDWLA